MPKYTFSISLLFVTVFFICCNQPQIKSVSNTKETKDTLVMKSSLKNTNDALVSIITCPKCGHQKEEIMPTDYCVIRYTCENCQTIIFPKEEDCCVYCSYGTKKCPSKQ